MEVPTVVLSHKTDPTMAPTLPELTSSTVEEPQENLLRVHTPVKSCEDKSAQEANRDEEPQKTPSRGPSPGRLTPTILVPGRDISPRSRSPLEPLAYLLGEDPARYKKHSRDGSEGWEDDPDSERKGDFSLSLHPPPHPQLILNLLFSKLWEEGKGR